VPGGENVNIMLGNRKLVLDNFCEVYDLLEHWADDSFWDLDQHTVVPGALYLIGSQQFFKHKDKIRHLVENNVIVAALSNPAEGSATIKWKIHRLEIFELIQQGKMFVISGGDIEPEYVALIYDSFLPKVLDYQENLQAIDQSQDIYKKVNKPYKFLFLNGRARYHRKYLLEEFQQLGLLQQSLWTNLDASELDPRLAVWNQPGTLAAVPIKFLPAEYEVLRYRNVLQSSLDSVNHSDNREANTIGPLFNKNLIFGKEWGEIYLQAEPYIDTYFSVVTETVFDYPYSFRTEKIWKPIAMGHPFVAVANYGYYRDLHNMGFQTFDPIVDESFDNIEDNQRRINRIIEVVRDLCQQDLDHFIKECYTICKYNQEHFAEISIKTRKQFPDQLLQFVKDNHFD
jgi:hypothetical protein